MTKVQFNQNISLDKTEFQTVEDFFLVYLENFSSENFFNEKIEEWIIQADNWDFASENDVKKIFNKYL